jgi:ubiquinone/menaquinone biosynthesis C-methylase UbiE
MAPDRLPDDEAAVARYDEIAEWYDEAFAGYSASINSSSADLADLLGPGDGLCLDVGCGGGLHFASVIRTGRSVLGLDVSRGQLEVAKRRSVSLVQANALDLPISSQSTETVVATYIHTDVDDFDGVLNEVARVLRPGGRFIYIGVHPCFVGHFVERVEPDRLVLHPGYQDTGWSRSFAHFGPGVRSKVGARHLRLDDLVNGIIRSGLSLDLVRESGDTGPFPWRLALVATRPTQLPTQSGRAQGASGQDERPLRTANFPAQI